jgi:hypothetical protein
MGTYLATIVHNITTDGFGRHTAWVDGYQATDKLEIVGYLDVVADSDVEAAEKVWEHTNTVAAIGPRSMCVGDLVLLAEGDENETRSVSYLAVAGNGWTPVAEPRNAQYPAWKRG